ncbi:MAG: hypothetical protein AAF135_24640, partial [Bacteroidota bacterium]
MAKRKNKSIHLSEALVLNRYLLSLLGVKDFESLVKDLKASDLEGYDENNVSRLYTELSRQLRRGAILTRQQLY